MNKAPIDWKKLNEYHLLYVDEKYRIKHARLAIYVHDNPMLTYADYKAKADELGIMCMAKESMMAIGLCLEKEPELVEASGETCDSPAFKENGDLG